MDDEGALAALFFKGQNADTSGMATDLAGIAKELHALDRSEIKTWLRRGELLAQAKQLCSGDREFAAWLRTNNQARTTAYRAIRAWECFGKCANSARFSKEAMDILTGHPEAIQDALQIAATSPVTAKVARRLVGRSPIMEEATSNDRTRVFTGDGWKLSITLDQPGTDSDYLAALSQAMKQIQSRHSLTDRLLNRAG